VSGRAQNKPASGIAAPSPSAYAGWPSVIVTPQLGAEIDILQDRLNEAERVTRDLQLRVSTTISMGDPMNPGNQRAIALKEARDHAVELRTALDEARAALDRERLATVPDRFAECAKTFGAEEGSNGWARCSDVPADVLAACLDPIIVALAANQVSVPRIFNQVHHLVERAVPPACSPFMPRELFDTSSAVRSVIVERIRQRVKDAEDHPHSQQMQTTIR
jgi:hypothetical protein